jgi:hypothetical protein
MNKIYDKLLLGLAVVALLAGVGFYLLKFDATPGQPKVSVQVADNPYQAVPVPSSSAESVSWPEPAEQSTGWVYDVFTPPKIFIDENGRFSAEGWTPPEPFGVYLVEIQRKLYRIQLEGYIEEDLSDASKSLLLLYDEELKKSIRARIGAENLDSEFNVTEFTIERVRDANGNIQKNVIATILDTRTDQEVVLKHGEQLYDEGVLVTLRSTEDPAFNVELNEIGASFETSAGQYVLEAIDLESSTVTVKKVSADGRKVEVQQLSPQASVPPVAIPDSEVSNPKFDSAADAFDFIF